ncbi:MAG: hypothetical protein NPINA01_08590 [Nitrospinaceae bacterium]|nr:MAG: hypothetical protein NPINA01_08590 [Nitrospinaceae bacterium]
MKVLVTGATGFVGNVLLKALNARGHEIAVLTRNPDEAGSRLPVLCDIFPWNPEQAPPEANAFSGVDAVIHLAGENIAGGRWTQKRKERIKNSRILSTRHLVEAIGNLEHKPEVLVSSSAVGFYGGSGNGLLTEDHPPASCFLAEVCKEWEQEASKAESFNVRTVCLRTGMVLGKEGGAMKRMLPPFQMGLGGILENGKQWMSWIHVDDIAAMYIHAMETQSLKGVYNAVSPNPVTNLEFTKTLGKLVKRPTIFPIPELALKTIFGDMAQILMASQKVSADKISNTGFEFKYPDLQSALQQIVDLPFLQFQMEQWTPQPVQTIFDFFSDSKNLELLTPEYLHFKILRQSTEKIEEGTLLDYKLKLHGIPFRWQSKITNWNPMACFSDHQTKGPYSLWEHTHEFEEKNGGTLIRDKVNYKVPFGIPGEMLAIDFVQNDLKKIFNFRKLKIKELFGE